jgi:carbonic anhydrase
MHELVKGIHQLRPEEFRSAHRLFQLRTRGQRPRALLITCSDMPIDPYSLIPTNFADLYVLQNFGNLAAPYDPRHPEQICSVEPALALYSLDDIVVCGHTPCDVITNLLVAQEVDCTAIAPVASTLGCAERTRHIMAEHYGQLDGAMLLTAAVEVNVLVQLENLRTIPEVAGRLARGELHLHGWVYADGALLIYQPDQEQFSPLNQ